MQQKSSIAFALNAFAGVILIAVVVGVVVGAFFFFPSWGKWRADQAGQAELRKAESSRRVQIEDARAKAEAAEFLNEAEVIRARGLAEANSIIAESLAGPSGDAYLRYLWITEVAVTDGERIYIPTEAGLPILEAGNIR